MTRQQTTIDWPAYPPRPSVFPLRVLYALVTAEAAREIGAAGFALVMVIAQQEDRMRCTRPARCRNFELCAALGGISENSLAEIRRRTVEAGWLHYQKGNRNSAPVYWVTIPLAYDDAPPPSAPAISPDMTSNFEVISGGKRGAIQGETTPHSIPIPKPIPAPTPTLAAAAVVVEGKLIESQEWGIGRTTGGSVSGALSNPAQSAVSRLIALKVTRAGETIAEAQANGLTLEQIAAVITFAEAHPDKYGPGAIVIRLTLKSAAHFPADQGWPPAKPTPAASASRLASDQAANRQAQRQADQAARANRERLTQLELQYGPEIDARGPEQLAELLTPDDPIRPLLFNRRFGPTAPLVRSRLLEILAASAN